MEKQEMILNLSGCADRAAVHERLRVTFGFPTEYGANLDALWDMGCDYIAAATVRICGVQSLSADLQGYILEDMMAVFRDIEKEKGTVSFVLED